MSRPLTTAVADTDADARAVAALAAGADLFPTRGLTRGPTEMRRSFDEDVVLPASRWVVAPTPGHASVVGVAVCIALDLAPVLYSGDEPIAGVVEVLTALGAALGIALPAGPGELRTGRAGSSTIEHASCVVLELRSEDEPMAALAVLCSSTPESAPEEPPVVAATAFPLLAEGGPSAPVATSARSAVAEHVDGLGVLRGVEMSVTAELGRASLTVRELLQLVPGSVIELDRTAGSPVDLLVNGTLIARGEVVVIDEEYGIRISEITDARGER